MIINKLNVHILSKYEQNVSKRLTYVVYSVIINTEHTFYIGEYKNEKRTKPRVDKHINVGFLLDFTDSRFRFGFVALNVTLGE